MAASDFQINSRVRSIFAKFWIDTQRMRIASFRGTVRLCGVLSLLGDCNSRRLDAAQLELILGEIRAIKEVVRVHADFENWRRDEAGRMVPIETTSSSKASPTLYADVSESAPPPPRASSREDEQ